MISRQEILQRAQVLSLQPSVVEKDYVLGCLLYGSGCHPDLAGRWVFKGGPASRRSTSAAAWSLWSIDFASISAITPEGDLPSKVGSTTANRSAFHTSALQRIKLDLTADDLIVREPQRLRCTHHYPDGPGEGVVVLCYDYFEVSAEKVRALGDRGRARDLYDVVHLYRARARSAGS